MNIYIGRDDEVTFNNICNLVQNRFISTDIISKVDLYERKIYEANNGNVYIFDPTINSIEVSDGTEKGMSKQGASWFGYFHGKKIDTGKAAWTSLINAVAEYYHANYSYVEFKQEIGRRGYLDKEKVERHKSIISNFLNLFYEKVAISPVINHQSNKYAIDDVYCVSLKMEMDDGGRQTKPILCKVYFRKRGDEFTPIWASDALEIDQNIEEIVTDGDGMMEDTSSEAIEENRKTIEIVVNAFDKAIKGKGLVNYIVYSSEKDVEDVNDLVDNGPSGFVRLECKNVKIIGLSHVVWRNDLYDVTLKGKRTLRFEFGINDKFTAYCVNCGKKLLVDANRISFMDIEDEEEIEREYFLENDNENFGLSEEDLSLILTKSELPKHLFMLSCSSKSLQSSHGCSRICCESQTLEFEGKQKCKDCTIPEIIYRNKKGEVYLTELLQFARNKMELVPTKVDGAQNIFTCTCCNRQFTGSGMADKYKTYCKFCHDYAVKDVSSFTPKIQESGKELYEKYKQMLPISIRMMNLFKQKYCFEEVDIILFRLENEVYIVDKLELEEDGYLQNPIKVNIER